nr:MAG TPA: hypothetical protein [Ackermannviridae sp.]
MISDDHEGIQVRRNTLKYNERARKWFSLPSLI